MSLLFDIQMVNIFIGRHKINKIRIFQGVKISHMISFVVFYSFQSVTTDYHCIDSYMQLSYCNLCSGRHELPCLSNCMNVIESCLGNLTLIDDVWRNFIGKHIYGKYYYFIEFL